MPLIAQIGDVVKSRKELTFEWNICDIFNLSDKANDYYHSPDFSFADTTWYLRLYPNGETIKEASSTGWIGLYLMRGDPKPHRVVTLTFEFDITCSGRKNKVMLEGEISTKDSGKGVAKFWSRSEIPRDKAVTIICHLKCCDQKALEVSTSSRLREVSQDFREILHCGERADFTLRVADQEWPVHKVILERRCKYFQNMFRHDWVENTENEVRFDDIDEKAMETVLAFIYSGVVEGMSVENVCEIYVVAHKFLLDDLKVLSVEFMSANISLKTVCKLILIAYTYSEEDLKERLLEYCIQETDSIFGTKQWKELEKNNLSVVVELLKETTIRSKTKQTKE